MNADFISAIQELGKEKGIDPELLFQAVDDALVAAYKKNTGTNQNVRVEMNKETGEIHVYAQRTVVEGEADGINEMTLEDAQAINPQYLAGDIVEVEVTPKNFGRIAAQNAKQFVVQRMRQSADRYMNASKAVPMISLPVLSSAWKTKTFISIWARLKPC